jgi:DNA-binding transcriptional ArsR family regulator
MALEEDTYSLIFSSLKHPARRKILRILGEGPSTYTELQRKLDVETGFLNYYLDSLDGLIAKNKDGRYRVSELGSSALTLIRQVEEPTPKKEFRQLTILGFKINIAYLAFAIISILTVSNVYWVYAFEWRNQEKTNLMGESILNIKVLLNESLEIVSTTIRESRIEFYSWYSLLDDITRISGEFKFLKSLDAGHLSQWSQVELATDALAEFVSDVLRLRGYQYYPYMNFTYGKGWIISMTKIRDGLFQIDGVLPSNIILGANPHIEMTDESYTKVFTVGLKLQQDIELVRSTVNLPKSLHWLEEIEP